MSVHQPGLFPEADSKDAPKADRRRMTEALSRIDGDVELHSALTPFCRLKRGEVWEDPHKGHRIGVIDATRQVGLKDLSSGLKPTLCIADPPYNIKVGAKNTEALFAHESSVYDKFTENWLSAVLPILRGDASFYVWLGADYKMGFHPIPEFCVSMRTRKEWSARNWITLRNQRGYGTQKNWMWVRQELFYYIKGSPVFNVEAEYTDIPKILRGYYKDVAGVRTENVERGKSGNIRAGNVWVDIQQIFYRLKENVPGCYAQKPIKSIERIIAASSSCGDTIIDPFSHSGTTLLAGEINGRRVLTCDIDPIYAEISIRRLERFRKTGLLGWQCDSPFPELNP